MDEAGDDGSDNADGEAQYNTNEDDLVWVGKRFSAQDYDEHDRKHCRRTDGGKNPFPLSWPIGSGLPPSAQE